MRRVLRLSAAVAAALCASCSRESQRTYDLNEPERWDVGEVVTRSERDDSLITMHLIEANGKEVHVVSHARGGESKIVQRCVEIDDDGALRRSLVYVATWVHREQAEDDDRSIEGAFVETSPRGWTFLSKGVRPSDRARAWLDEQFNSPSPAITVAAAGFRSPHPIAVGEGWAAPATEFVRAAFGSAELTPAGREFDIDIKLTGVESTPFGDAVTAAETLDAPVSSEEFMEGSRTTLRGTCTFVLGRPQRRSVRSFEGETTILTTRDGRNTRGVIKSKTSSSSDAGGEMPAPPAK